jgi:hypothetical protein
MTTPKQSIATRAIKKAILLVKNKADAINPAIKNSAQKKTGL